MPKVKNYILTAIVFGNALRTASGNASGNVLENASGNTPKTALSYLVVITSNDFLMKPLRYIIIL